MQGREVARPPPRAAPRFDGRTIRKIAPADSPGEAQILASKARPTLFLCAVLPLRQLLPRNSFSLSEQTLLMRTVRLIGVELPVDLDRTVVSPGPKHCVGNCD
jgi:hypothetical protein